MKVTLLKPADAPLGIQRILPLLQESLTAADYRACRFLVAFARTSGVARLLPQIRAWRKKKLSIQAIVGIDSFGTSSEALQLLLTELDAVYVTRTPHFSCTFHPKLYLFDGPTSARAFVGSHNLTSGGLETNFEAGVVIDASLPAEDALWKPFQEAWDQLLPASSPSTLRLDAKLLEQLVSLGQVLSEVRLCQRRSSEAGKGTDPGKGKTEPFPMIPPVPPSPIPKESVRELQRPRIIGGKRLRRPAGTGPMPKALVMEILPHHNGEILLSKTAADAFPEFFGLPFTGRTKSKIASNPSYSMREPDPQVEWRLYDDNDNVIHRSRFALNTVLYARKSEFRITVTKSLADAMAQYSIMVMWGGSSNVPTGLDYVVEVFPPGSAGWKKWLPAMNITLPGGGKAKPRRMGWI